MASKRISGKDLQKTVIGYARSRGWLCAHFPSVETKQGWRTPIAADAKGFPDIICVRDRLVAIEIKGSGDKIRDEQSLWRDRFHRAGVEHYIIKPDDWMDGTVEEIFA